MQNIASIASLDGKFSNSSGRKTVIQALRYDFDPLEISKLTGHANPESISSYSHNHQEKQRQRQLYINGNSSHVLREIILNSSARQAMQQLRVTVTAVPVVLVT